MKIMLVRIFIDFVQHDNSLLAASIVNIEMHVVAELQQIYSSFTQRVCQVKCYKFFSSDFSFAIVK